MSRRDLLAKVRDASRTHGAISELAAALNKSRGTIYNKLRQDDGFTDEELKKAAATLVVAEAERILERAEAGVVDELPDGFVLVPRVDVEAAAGKGALTGAAGVLDHMAFRADFVRRVLKADPDKLVLVTAVGDSMEPAVRAGDLLLVDTGVERIVDDAIYVLVKHGDLVVKRVQQHFDGTVTVRSDNPAYDDEALDADAAAGISVAGRLRWIGRMI